jgi:Tfp pilus assembly protein PilN
MEIRLNIIPNERKKEIASSNRLRRVLEWEFGFSLILTIFLLLLLSMYYLLNFNLAAQKSEIVSGKGKEEFDKIAKFNDDFKTANKQITMDESIQKDQLYWSNLFIKLNDAVPDSVSVTKMATKNYQVLMAGTARTRDDLIGMRENFSREGCFTNINLPLSNLISKDNVDFQIQFDIKEECVKNK